MLARQARRELVQQHNLSTDPDYQSALDNDDLSPDAQAQLLADQMIADNKWLDENAQLVISTVERKKLSQRQTLNSTNFYKPSLITSTSRAWREFKPQFQQYKQQNGMESIFKLFHYETLQDIQDLLQISSNTMLSFTDTQLIEQLDKYHNNLFDVESMLKALNMEAENYNYNRDLCEIYMSSYRHILRAHSDHNIQQKTLKNIFIEGISPKIF